MDNAEEIQGQSQKNLPAERSAKTPERRRLAILLAILVVLGAGLFVLLKYERVAHVDPAQEQKRQFEWIEKTGEIPREKLIPDMLRDETYLFRVDEQTEIVFHAEGLRVIPSTDEKVSRIQIYSPYVHHPSDKWPERWPEKLFLLGIHRTNNSSIVILEWEGESLIERQEYLDIRTGEIIASTSATGDSLDVFLPNGKEHTIALAFSPSCEEGDLSYEEREATLRGIRLDGLFVAEEELRQAQCTGGIMLLFQDILLDVSFSAISLTLQDIDTESGVPSEETFVFSLTDPVAYWKTYRNEERGIEFRYPAGMGWRQGSREDNGLSVSTDFDTTLYGIADKSDEHNPYPGAMVIDINLSDSWDEDLFDILASLYTGETVILDRQVFTLGKRLHKYTKIRDIDAGGYPGVQYRVELPDPPAIGAYFGPGEYTMIKRGEDVAVTIGLRGMGTPITNVKRSLIDRMVNTVRFFEEKQGADNWKSYQNKERGISFSYPPTWILSYVPGQNIGYGENVLQIRVSNISQPHYVTECASGYIDLIILTNLSKPADKPFEQALQSLVVPGTSSFYERANPRGMGLAETFRSGPVEWPCHGLYYLIEQGPTSYTEVTMRTDRQEDQDILESILDTLSFTSTTNKTE